MTKTEAKLVATMATQSPALHKLVVQGRCKVSDALHIWTGRQWTGEHFLKPTTPRRNK